MPVTHTAHTARPLLWLVAAALFLQTLDSTIVNTALPAMALSLNENALAMHGIIVSYALTMALLIPASGWLADRFGTRRVFLTAIVTFALGSLLCALAPNLNQLIAARVLQGIGGAMLLPIGRLTVLRTVPREQFLEAMSFIAVPGLLGPLVGPALGGWIVEAASWHWIFHINLPVCLIGVVLALRVMPNFQAEVAPRFDWMGYVLLTLGLLLLSLALTDWAQQAGAGVQFLVFVLAAAAWVGYWYYARGRADVIFPTSLAKITSLRIGSLGNVASRLGSSGMPYFLPLLLQLPLGYSPAQAGMMLVPIALASMLAKKLVTVLVSRYGYRRVLVGNTLSLGALMVAFALVDGGTPIWFVLLLMSLYGLCNSLQFSAMNTLALRDVTAEQASSANSLLSMVQMTAVSLGLGAAAMVLNAYSDYFAAGVGNGDLINAFRAAFVTMGLVTMASSYVFARLPKKEADYDKPTDPMHASVVE